MSTNVLKSQKTSSNLGNLYIDDWKKGGIRVDTLHLVFYNFQGLDQDSTRLKK